MAAIFKLLNRAVTWYNGKNQTAPFRTSIISVTFMYGFGDYISQMFCDAESAIRKWYEPD
jgi:hypothetical protein